MAAETNNGLLALDNDRIILQLKICTHGLKKKSIAKRKTCFALIIDYPFSIISSIPGRMSWAAKVVDARRYRTAQRFVDLDQ